MTEKKYEAKQQLRHNIKPGRFLLLHPVHEIGCPLNWNWTGGLEVVKVHFPSIQDPNFQCLSRYYLRRGLFDFAKIVYKVWSHDSWYTRLQLLQVVKWSNV